MDNKKLKDNFHNFQLVIDEMPPLDNNDDFFYNGTAAFKYQYLYEGLKLALAAFQVQKEMNNDLTKKVLQLEAEISALRTRR